MSIRKLFNNRSFQKAMCAACAVIGAGGLLSSLFMAVNGTPDVGFLPGAVTLAIGMYGLHRLKQAPPSL